MFVVLLVFICFLVWVLFGVLGMVSELKSLDMVRVNVNRGRSLHSIESHNFWLDRNGVCPYCLNGSVPVTKVEILEILEL